VTSGAACGLSLSFERVPDEEAAAVHLAAFDSLRSPTLDGELRGRVVAPVAVCLGVAGLAQLSVLQRHLAVMTRERLVVPKKGLGERSSELACGVAGRALSGFPLCLVLVTREALAHRRQRRASLLDHPAMTGHALALYFLHAQVLIVIETDGRAQRWRPLEQLPHPALIRMMTGAAQRRIRTRVARFALRGAAGMTGVAIQASWLARRSAGEADQMRQVREARSCPLRTGRRQSRRENG